MNYQKMLTIIAKESGTTPKDVEREMQEAVFSAGISCQQEHLLLCVVPK